MARKRPVQFPAQPIDGNDLDFRPASYWDAADPAAAITQNIEGQLRREMVRDFISGDAPKILGEIDDELLKDEVSDETRRFLGRMHPSWMGGEYLPSYPRGEVEIARIVLESTLGDVMSIRGRRTHAGTVLVRMEARRSTERAVRTTEATSSSPRSRPSCSRSIASSRPARRS